MRVFVFLLVLANLLFYAFSAGYFGQPDNPDAERLEQQVAPERLRIVSRGETPKVKATPPPAPVVSEPEKTEESQPEASRAEAPVRPTDTTPVCLAWERLSVADADRLIGLLGDQFPAFKANRRVTAAESGGWWVHIPPLASKAEVDKKAAELRQIEVTDYFVIQEGPNRFAISLGIFSTEKGGQERLAELRAKGVRSARLLPRPGKDGTVRLQATGPASAREALVAAAGKALPKQEVKACR